MGFPRNRLVIKPWGTKYQRWVNVLGQHDRIRDSFAAQSMMQTLGATLVDIADGQVSIRAPVLPGSRQQQGVAHAGLTFALGDTAAGYAALTTMKAGFEVLTVEMKINLLAPATGPTLTATGRVVKSGRRLVVVSAEVINTDPTGHDTLVAIMQGTMIPAPAQG